MPGKGLADLRWEDDDDDGIVIGGFRRVNSDEPLDFPDSIGGRDFEIGNEIGTLENLIVQPTITAQPRPQYKIIHDWLFGSVLGEGSYAKVKEVLHTQTLVGIPLIRLETIKII